VGRVFDALAKECGLVMNLGEGLAVAGRIHANIGGKARAGFKMSVRVEHEVKLLDFTKWPDREAL
jgi:hypothetical protein